MATSSSPSDDGCAGDELEAGGQRSAVGHEDALHAGRVELAAGDLVHDPERRGLREGARRAVDVGDPADLLLEVAAGVGDHRGVEPHAAHHDEGVLDGAAVRALEGGEAHVDGQVVALERGADHRLGVAERQEEVAGQEVAGAARHDRERHVRPAHGLRHGPHRPVAAGDEHRIDLLGERPAGDAVAEVLDRGLEEERLVPARLGRQARDRGAQLLRVDLDGVVDEGGATQRRLDIGGRHAIGRHVVGTVRHGYTLWPPFRASLRALGGPRRGGPRHPAHRIEG